METTKRSSVREMTGRTEIGLKSDGRVGVETLGIGLIIASFHWFGTVESISERVNKWAIGRLKNGAATRRNQLGRSSPPQEVGFSLSRCLNTDISEIMHSLKEVDVHLSGGGS